MRKLIYNVVTAPSALCPEGALLTDRELERIKLHNDQRDWPVTRRVKVWSIDCYKDNGLRYATVLQEFVDPIAKPLWKR